MPKPGKRYRQANDAIDAAMRIVEGTARSMGIEVEG